MRVGKKKVERATQAIRYIRQRPPHVRLKESANYNSYFDNPEEFMQTLIEDINELLPPEERL